jgi:hypothetical protein
MAKTAFHLTPNTPFLAKERKKMYSDLAVRRRVLLVTYERYLKADRDWDTELREVRTLFPSSSQPRLLIIGDRGSRIRKIHDERQRALMQLQAAHLKFETAKQRLALRREKTPDAWVVLLT